MTAWTSPATRPASSSVPPVVAVEGLCVSYDGPSGAVPAVCDVSFELRPGELLGVIGESGSGKSTLGRAMLGLLPSAARITGGAVRFASSDGPLDLIGLGRRRLRHRWGTELALVPQATASALDSVKRVGDQFNTTYRAHGQRDRKQNRERARAALRGAGLDDPDRVLRMYPHELSGGMAQRVVVALAVALEPRLLVADEPTSALDVTVQRTLLDNLSQSVAETGRGCLLITHDLGVVANYCHRVIVMYDGYAVESGPVESVLQQPAHPFTERLIEALPGGTRAARAVAGPRPAIDAASLVAGRHCPYVLECESVKVERCLSELPPRRTIDREHDVRSFCADERGSVARVG